LKKDFGTKKDLLSRFVGQLQFANIRVARCDNTGEWCPNDIECFSCFQPIDVGLVCHHYRLVLSIGVRRSIIILPIARLLAMPNKALWS